MLACLFFLKLSKSALATTGLPLVKLTPSVSILLIDNPGCMSYLFNTLLAAVTPSSNKLRPLAPYLDTPATDGNGAIISPVSQALSLASLSKSPTALSPTKFFTSSLASYEFVRKVSVELYMSSMCAPKPR